MAPVRVLAAAGEGGGGGMGGPTAKERQERMRKQERPSHGPDGCCCSRSPSCAARKRARRAAAAALAHAQHVDDSSCGAGAALQTSLTPAALAPASAPGFAVCCGCHGGHQTCGEARIVCIAVVRHVGLPGAARRCTERGDEASGV